MIKNHNKTLLTSKFMMCKIIASRTQSGKCMLFTAKKVVWERNVALYEDQFARFFRSGRFNELNVYSSDETETVFLITNQPTQKKKFNKLQIGHIVWGLQCKYECMPCLFMVFKILSKLCLIFNFQCPWPRSGNDLIALKCQGMDWLFFVCHWL